MDDPFDLRRFVEAQDPVFERVLDELRTGRKRSHWMWFVFPQLRDLGRSATAQRYGLASLAEARAYWAHPVLGPRLAACVDLLLAYDDPDPRRVLGAPDDLKLRSCLTLFAAAVPDEPRFAAALGTWYGGAHDDQTLALLADR